MKTRHRIALRGAFAAGFAGMASLNAHAQMRGFAERGPPPVWDVTLGAGAAIRPTFEGSDRTRVRPLPFVSVKWRDTISFGEGGLSATWHRKSLRAGIGLTFDPGRNDGSDGGIFGSGDSRLKGLGTIDKSLGLRAFAGWRLGPLGFDVSGTKYTGAVDHGILANLGVSLPLPLGRRLILVPHVRTTWADGNYTQSYFGVTAAQSAASIFPRFTAGAGFKDVSAGLNIIYLLGKHWSLIGNVGYTRLLGDAKASPISISDDSRTAFAAIGYRF